MTKVSFLGVHCSSAAESEETRYDTLISPNSGVATLREIALNTLDSGHLGEVYSYDYAFPGVDLVRGDIFEKVEDALVRDEKVVVGYSALVYNARQTLEELAVLKKEFGCSVITVLGGQLIPFAKEAYQRNSDIDVVAEGDGEVLLPRILDDVRLGIHSGYYKCLSSDKRFALPNYDNYFGLVGRLDLQESEYGLRQLSIQGVGGPGCSWAAGNKKGACSFCALQNIEVMNKTPLELYVRCLSSLQDQFRVTRFFDVGNQFLPSLKVSENESFLEELIRLRQIYSVTADTYAYLTVASIKPSLGPLLKKAGVSEVYVGVDHFDDQVLRQQNKSGRESTTFRALDVLRTCAIKFRMGVVVGASEIESTRSFQSLENGIERVMTDYRGIVQSVGVFPIYVLPGSKVYEELRLESSEARDIMDKFSQKLGYFSPQEVRELSRIQIIRSGQDPEAVMDSIDRLKAKISIEGIHCNDADAF